VEFTPVENNVFNRDGLGTRVHDIDDNPLCICKSVHGSVVVSRLDALVLVETWGYIYQYCQFVISIPLTRNVPAYLEVLPP